MLYWRSPEHIPAISHPLKHTLARPSMLTSVILPPSPVLPRTDTTACHDAQLQRSSGNKVPMNQPFSSQEAISGSELPRVVALLASFGGVDRPKGHDLCLPQDESALLRLFDHCDLAE